MVECVNTSRRSNEQLWAYVISWGNWRENAQFIARSISAYVDRLIVIYSNPDEEPESGAGEWIQVPNSHFYGSKFNLALRQFSGRTMLHIQADVSCDDWRHLIERCRSAFATDPSLAIWTPDIHRCAFDLERTLIRKRDDGLQEVARTDAIVWALSSDLCTRLGELDYSHNTYGWGIDAAAAALSRTEGWSIALDESVPVIHPYGSGYDTGAAAWLMHDFFFQLSSHERRVVKLLYDYSDLRSLLAEDSSALEARLAPSTQMVKDLFTPLARRLRHQLRLAQRRAAINRRPVDR